MRHVFTASRVLPALLVLQIRAGVILACQKELKKLQEASRRSTHGLSNVALQLIQVRSKMRDS